MSAQYLFDILIIYTGNMYNTLYRYSVRVMYFTVYIQYMSNTPYIFRYSIYAKC